MDKKTTCWKIILVVFLLSLFSCSEILMKDKIVSLMESPIRIPKELSDSTSIYRIIRYVRTTSCTSCQLELGIWRVYRKKLKNKFGDKVNVNFIIDTSKPKEVEDLVSMYRFQNISYIDSTGYFVKNNTKIKEIGKEVVMFVNHENKVVLIGNPCRNKKIEWLIDSILTNDSQRYL